MISAVLLCFSIICGLNAQPKQDDNNILYWTKDHRLTFDDFEGKPNRQDTTLRIHSPTILTHKLGAIIKSINVHLITEGGKTTFIIHAAMKKNLSWIKDKGDTISLSHEQGHFDICEIYARILRRDIKHARSLLKAKEIYEQTSYNEEVEQDNYDKENSYQAGGITMGWKERIFCRLRELEQYADVTVTLPF